jgi:hypothetical protein
MRQPGETLPLIALIPAPRLANSASPASQLELRLAGYQTVLLAVIEPMAIRPPDDTIFAMMESP